MESGYSFPRQGRAGGTAAAAAEADERIPRISLCAKSSLLRDENAAIAEEGNGERAQLSESLSIAIITEVCWSISYLGEQGAFSASVCAANDNRCMTGSFFFSAHQSLNVQQRPVVPVSGLRDSHFPQVFPAIAQMSLSFANYFLDHL